MAHVASTFGQRWSRGVVLVLLLMGCGERTLLLTHLALFVACMLPSDLADELQHAPGRPCAWLAVARALGRWIEYFGALAVLALLCPLVLRLLCASRWRMLAGSALSFALFDQPAIRHDIVAQMLRWRGRRRALPRGCLVGILLAHMSESLRRRRERLRAHGVSAARAAAPFVLAGLALVALAAALNMPVDALSQAAKGAEDAPGLGARLGRAVWSALRRCASAAAFCAAICWPVVVSALAMAMLPLRLERRTLRDEERSPEPERLAALESLERFTVPWAAVTADADPVGAHLAGRHQCAVCLEALAPCEAATRLPCGHAFHTGCITPWLTVWAVTCPTCRAGI